MLKPIFIPKELRSLYSAVKQITGIKPSNLRLYKQALSHSSVSKESIDSNERLEYLGDAILGAVIAEYLFKKYPFRTEGFLTEVRSKVVNRETLNNLAVKLGLDKIVYVGSNRNPKHTYKSIYGNALEALVGAIYLDKGFKACQVFILDKLLKLYLNLDEIIQKRTNFKSALIEWAQKHTKKIEFRIISESGSQHKKEFIAQVFLDGIPSAQGSGLSKKKAEQNAAERAFQALSL